MPRAGRMSSPVTVCVRGWLVTHTCWSAIIPGDWQVGRCLAEWWMANLSLFDCSTVLSDITGVDWFERVTQLYHKVTSFKSYRCLFSQWNILNIIYGIQLSLFPCYAHNVYKMNRECIDSLCPPVKGWEYMEGMAEHDIIGYIASLQLLSHTFVPLHPSSYFYNQWKIRTEILEVDRKRHKQMARILYPFAIG